MDSPSRQRGEPARPSAEGSPDRSGAAPEAATEGGWDRRRRQVAGDIERTAVRLFAERGYAAVTVGDVAAESGMSPRTVARYFPLKEDLLLAVPRRRRQQTLEALEQLRSHPDPLAGMIAQFKALAVAHGPELEEFRTWVQAVGTAPELRGQAFGDLFLETAAVLTELCADALGVDPVEDLRPGVLAHALVAAVDAAVVYWYRRGGTDDWGELLDRVLETLRRDFPLL
jgi:AcrR family transcriptional regulator